VKYIVANWKMNMNMQDVINWAAGFDTSVLSKEVSVIVAPASLHLFPVADLMKRVGVKISAQDASIEEKGAHTGETGAFQLKEMCNYAIVGHSEICINDRVLFMHGKILQIFQKMARIKKKVLRI